MSTIIQSWWDFLSLARKFAFASAVVLMVGMLALGWWMDKTIEKGVTKTTGETAALYMKSFIGPQIQELAKHDGLSPSDILTLKALITDTPLGSKLASIKVWTTKGQIVYSNQSELIGKIFPVDEDLASALSGRTSSELSLLDHAENITERMMGEPLLEIYSPIGDATTGKVIGALEFYQRADDLVKQLAQARFYTWLNIGLGSLIIFALLYGIVREGSKTITRQRTQLEARVGELTEVLSRNTILDARVRESARRATELNEQFLRRVSTDLHDGPAQGIGFALISFETVEKALKAKNLNGSTPEILAKVRNALEQSLKEIRNLCGGMALPELDGLTLPQTVRRVIRAHEIRTDTRVVLDIEDSPHPVEAPVKISIYRFVQEALNNAYRHGGGRGQKVQVEVEGEDISVSVSDQGGGFVVVPSEKSGQHLGLIGMRRRVESFGGTFTIANNVNGGVRVSGTFPVSEESAAHG
jgi:signal transduction histidine kinase